jgi:hypothetical protein
MMKRLVAACAAAVCIAALSALPATAEEADVVDVGAAHTGGDRWRFEVTVSSPDTGWDYYADGWQVVAPDGTVLNTRTLHHPHENEQPFTRSLSGVEIPDDVNEVVVRARMNEGGYGGEEMTVPLER